MKKQSRANILSYCMVSITCSLVLVACGSGGGGGTAADNRATIGISGSLGTPDTASDSGFSSRVTGRDVVEPGTINTLTLNVTKIEMHHAGDDAEVPPAADHIDEGEGTDEEGGQGWIVVYEDVDGMDIELVALDGITAVVDTVDLPAGRYTKIRIYYENPRLTLVGEEGTELTDIHITANGRMFISQTFTLEQGGATLIFIDFGGVHLTFNPVTGRYVLTPQLRVVLNLESAEVVIEGIITNKSDEATMMIQLDNSRDVFGTESTLYWKEIVEEPGTMALEGGFVGLMLEDLVEVAGIAQQDGSVTADVIEVLLPPE